MRKPWLALPLLAVAACGDDSPSVTIDAPTGTADGPVATADADTGGTPDADTTPDADPGPQPDANLSKYDFSCAGMSTPTTAPDPLVLAGTIQGIAGFGEPTPQEMVDVEAHNRADDTLLAEDMSDATGAFSITYPNASMTAVDGYLKMTKSTFVDTYIYPPDPMFENLDNLDALIISSGIIGTVYSLAGQTYDASTSSTAVVLVVDCAGTPIEGATASFEPTAGAVRYLDGMFPTATAGTDASGTVFGFNVPVGAGTIATAEYMGVALEGHTFETYVNSLSVTIVHP